MNLYENIKNRRLERGWNQTELAKRTGYSDKSMIAKIESGKVDLSQKKIEQFADVFGCSVVDLMGYQSTGEEIFNYIIENLKYLDNAALTNVIAKATECMIKNNEAGSKLTDDMKEEIMRNCK